MDNISSPKSDIISLEAVVEGHIYSNIQIHFTQASAETISPAGGEFMILFRLKCMQIPINEDSVTDTFRWWSSQFHLDANPA